MLRSLFYNSKTLFFHHHCTLAVKTFNRKYNIRVLVSGYTCNRNQYFSLCIQIATLKTIRWDPKIKNNFPNHISALLTSTFYKSSHFLWNTLTNLYISHLILICRDIINITLLYRSFRCRMILSYNPVTYWNIDGWVI